MYKVKEVFQWKIICFVFSVSRQPDAAGCTGRAGVCGKQADTAQLQDQLTGALIGLARAAEGNVPGPSTDKVIIEGLFTTVTNVNFNNETINTLIDRVHEEKHKHGAGL